MAASAYDSTFFSFHEQGSRNSARVTIPLLFEFARPASVVDVGCGNGTWLAEFQAAGVADVLGVDGDYVLRDQLLIAPSCSWPATWNARCNSTASSRWP